MLIVLIEYRVTDTIENSAIQPLFDISAGWHGFCTVTRDNIKSNKLHTAT